MQDKNQFDSTPINELDITTYNPSKLFKRKTRFSITTTYYHAKKFSFPIQMHAHSFYEINIITEGNGYHLVDNHRITAKKGDIFVIPPKTRHGYSATTNDFDVLHIILTMDFIKKYNEELNYIDGYNMLFTIAPILRVNGQKFSFFRLTGNELKILNKDFMDLERLSNSDSSSDNVALIGKTIYTIAKLCSFTIEKQSNNLQKNNTSDENNGDVMVILNIMGYIQKNFANKLTIDSLSKIAKMSRSSLTKKFKQYTKLTINEYITKIRINESALLLIHTNKSISDIAQDCGFFDSAHFTRTFIAMEKQSPLNYRNIKKIDTILDVPNLN